MQQPLILAMMAHVALTTCLYMLLTVARAPAVWGIGRRADGSDPWAGLEPRIGANLSNQFEWPVFFHVACLVLMQSPAKPSSIALAWTFVAGRLAHSVVQVLVPSIRLRGLVFMVNFLAVLGLWVLIAADALGVAP